MISARVVLKAHFYDLDPMQVVWHGNYPRFLEQARCALLDKIGFNYPEMAATNYIWPIVEMRDQVCPPDPPVTTSETWRRRCWSTRTASRSNIASPIWPLERP